MIPCYTTWTWIKDRTPEGAKRQLEESLKECYNDVAKFADSEGLECHASAVRVRFEE